MAIPKEVVAKLDAASNAFDGVITKTEQKIFDSAVELIKKLDVDASGNIKMSTANLKVLSDIKSRLSQIASKDKAYLQGVKELAASFDSIYKSQTVYYAKHFAEKTLNDKAKAKYEAMKRVAVTTTIDGLTGAGLQSNVLDPLAKTLLRAVTSGAKYADLVNELRNQLMTTDTGEGSLAKYAKTYATTALTQYAGQNNKLFTDDLGAEWFQYVGSEIETTREFCHHLTAKEFIHVSEIPDILAGKIEYDGKVHQCKMNPKTDLPYGLIEGTTPENFQVNVGGWNCRHQLVPVAKEAVPQDIRAKFDKQTQEEIAKQKAEEEHKKAEEEKKQKIAELQKQLEPFSKWKDAPVAGIQSAVAAGDIPALEKYIGNMHDIEKQLEQLSLIPDAKKAAQQFTVSELQAVQDAVAKKLAQLSSMPLHVQAQKLTNEITIYADKLKKYPTWQIAESAYSVKLQEVQSAIAMQSLKSEFYALQTYKTKSPQYKDSLSQLNEAIASGDVTKAQSLVSELKAKQAALDARKAKYAQKAHKQTNFDDETYTQERLDNAVWNRRNDSDCISKHYEISNVEDVWSKASSEEKHAAYQYTAGSSYLTEPLRGDKCKFWRYKNGRLTEIERDTEALTRLIDKSYCSQDVWVKRDDLWAFCVYRWNLTMKPEIIKWYRKQNSIPETTTDEQIEKSLEYTSTGGERNYQEILRAYYKNHPNQLVGITGTDESFLSTANNKEAHFKNDGVTLNIFCPRQTRMIYAASFSRFENGGDHCGTEDWDGKTRIMHQNECEYILQRGTRLRIIKAFAERGHLYIDCVVEGQTPRAIDRFTDDGGMNYGIYAVFAD